RNGRPPRSPRPGGREEERPMPDGFRLARTATAAVLLGALLAVASGAASAPILLHPTRTPFLLAAGPGAPSAEKGDFAGRISIGGGRKMYIECRGTGSPTVVFVSGLRYSADEWSA